MQNVEDQTYGTVLTNDGFILLGEILATNCDLEITRATIGDGIHPENVVLQDVSALLNEVKNAEIVDITSPKGGEADICIQVLSTGVQQGFFAREIGIFARNQIKQEILYSYTYVNDHPQWIRPEGQGVATVAEFSIKIIVDRVQNIVAQISPSYHQLEAKFELIDIDHNLQGYPLIMASVLQYGAGMGGAGNGPSGGTNMKQITARAHYNDTNSLTVCTVRSIAKPGIKKTLKRVSNREFLVTFEGDDVNSIYIKLF